MYDFVVQKEKVYDYMSLSQEMSQKEYLSIFPSAMYFLPHLSTFFLGLVDEGATIVWHPGQPFLSTGFFLNKKMAPRILLGLPSPGLLEKYLYLFDFRESSLSSATDAFKPTPHRNTGPDAETETEPLEFRYCCRVHSC